MTVFAWNTEPPYSSVRKFADAARRHHPYIISLRMTEKWEKPFSREQVVMIPDLLLNEAENNITSMRAKVASQFKLKIQCTGKEKESIISEMLFL
jgi:hypothetical protein